MPNSKKSDMNGAYHSLPLCAKALRDSGWEEI